MEKDCHSIGNVDYIAKALSHGGLITALECQKGGVFVAASMDLKKGTKVIECGATSIALDPTHRRSHCGFCARPYPNPHLCENCQMIGMCPECSVAGRHEDECAALQALSIVFPGQDDAGQPNVDSSHLLTVRLLCQRDNMEWELAQYLHCIPLPKGIDAEIIAICSQIHCAARSASILSWVSNDVYKMALARVVGCSHAITDVSLPLGRQCIGQGLFLQHSFYNHSCAPNAFLSCNLMTDEHADKDREKYILASLHLLSDVNKDDQITISYIPTSGLGFQERQHRLWQGYNFVCDCESCQGQQILLEPNTDVDSIREIQFSCNERLLKMQESNVNTEEIDQIVSLIEMTQRGIRNQSIPQLHEVSIEANRLLAMAYSMSGQNDKAIAHNHSCISMAKQLGNLFDPVTLATQVLNYASVVDDDKLRACLYGEALTALQNSLGKKHPWVHALSRKFVQISSSDMCCKKRKICDR